MAVGTRAPLAGAALADYEAGFLAFLIARRAAMGEEEGGLYNYYVHRIETQRVLAPYERALIPLLSGKARLFHAGAGMGTLTLALGLAGVDCVLFESDERRHLAALAAQATLAPAARVEIRRAKFPAGLRREDAPRDATLLFTNIVSTWTEEQLDRSIAAMHGFAETWLDLRLFGVIRDTDEERTALADRIAAAGFTVTPLDIGVAGTFYVRIVSRDPARAPRLPSRNRPWWRRILGR
jgi:hypothetical protein